MYISSVVHKHKDIKMSFGGAPKTCACAGAPRVLPSANVGTLDSRLEPGTVAVAAAAALRDVLSGGDPVVLLVHSGSSPKWEKFQKKLWQPNANVMKKIAQIYIVDLEQEPLFVEELHAAAVDAGIVNDTEADVFSSIIQPTGDTPVTGAFSAGVGGKFDKTRIASGHDDAKRYIKDVKAAVHVSAGRRFPFGDVSPKEAAAIVCASPDPVVVLFHASWCVHCVAMMKETWTRSGTAELEQSLGVHPVSVLADQGERTTFSDALTDAALRAAVKATGFEDSGIPCILVVRNGTASMFTGKMSLAALKSKISNIL